MPQTPSETFRARLVEARKVCGYSNQAKLAERLGELGYPMHETTIARIEKGNRRVTLDDLVAIAAALDVAPVHLFLPIEGDEPVALTRKLEVGAAKARRWARGRQPLDSANARTYWFQSPGDVSDAHVEDAQELANYLARAGIVGRPEQEGGDDA